MTKAIGNFPKKTYCLQYYLYKHKILPVHFSLMYAFTKANKLLTKSLHFCFSPALSMAVFLCEKQGTFLKKMHKKDCFVSKPLSRY